MICFRKVDKRDSTEKKKIKLLRKVCIKNIEACCFSVVWKYRNEVGNSCGNDKKMRLANFGVESVSQLCKCT